MNFADIANMFNKLESTSARLEMISILSDFFKTVPVTELRNFVYIIHGKLHPDFFQIEFGMADKLVLKAIAFTSGTPEDKVEKMWLKEGDPGYVAESLINKKKQTTLFSEPLTFARVISGLNKIETSDGKDSQDRKMKILSNMLHDSDPIEAKYLCRIVTGRMRIGASTMTILDALAVTFANKENKNEIERAFNITCDIGLIAEKIAEEGMEGIRTINITVGKPIKVMLAERLPSISEIIKKMDGECAVEYKYDGIRSQVHIGKTFVKIFSRRLEDLTQNFSDIAQSLKDHFKGEEAIIEGECVSTDADGHIQSFQEVTHRRRKHGMNDVIKKYPVKIFIFDMLYVNGKDLTFLPYMKRRDAIGDWFDISDNIQMSKMKIVRSAEEMNNFFKDAINARCEGIMAKSISDKSIYQTGSRGFLWIKYKKDYHTDLIDTFDLVVVGAFYGMGKRAGKYGALLMASYDKDNEKYGTVCKLGTGFDDAFLDNMPSLLDKYKIKNKSPLVDAKMTPDVWFSPAVVLEVVGAEISVSPVHTAAIDMFGGRGGIGIRFPRFTGRIRDDKGPEQSTSVMEIAEMYKMQSHDSGELDRGHTNI